MAFVGNGKGRSCCLTWGWPSLEVVKLNNSSLAISILSGKLLKKTKCVCVGGGRCERSDIGSLVKGGPSCTGHMLQQPGCAVPQGLPLGRSRACVDLP